MEKQAYGTYKNLHPKQFLSLMRSRPSAGEALRNDQKRDRYVSARQSGGPVPSFVARDAAKAYSFSNRMVSEVVRDDRAARSSTDTGAKETYEQKWGGLDLRNLRPRTYRGR